MTETWKLPKSERVAINQLKDQLRGRIEDLRLTIIRDQAMLDSYIHEKTQKEKSLANLEKNYPVN
jgi:hypothetical protein